MSAPGGRALGMLVFLAGVIVAGVPPAAGRFLEFREAISNETFVPGLDSVGGIVITPDGQNLYTTTVNDAFPDDAASPAIDGFRRAAAGKLVLRQFYVETPPFGPLCGAGPLLVSPDGANVYVGATCAASVRVFARDPTTSKLAPLDSPRHEDGRPDGLEESLTFPIALSPDGKHVYAAGSGREIGVFRRDLGTGLLTFQEGRQLPQPVGRAGASSSRSAGGMALSPDGTNLYLTASEPNGDDDALLVFSRDPDTGSLTFLEAQEDGAGGFVSLADFFAVVVSPDGRHVYAGGMGQEPVLVAFARDAPSGKLTAIQAQAFGAPPVPVTSLAMSPDGHFLYAGGESLLAVLHRNVATGTLDLVDVYTGLNGIGYYSASGLAVSPDGADLYVTEGGDGAVAHLRKLCGDGRVDPGESCDDGNNEDGDGCSATCTVEVCWTCAGEPSVCTPADGSACNDGTPCTVGSTCHAGQCSGGTPAEGVPCDDGNACTSGDACRAGRCVPSSTVSCGACEACDRRYGCVGVLRSGCFRSPADRPTGILKLTVGSDGTDQLVWRWRPDPRLSQATTTDLGDPTRAADYTLCVLDHSHLGVGVRRRRAVVAALQLPGGNKCGPADCWHRLRRGGFRYSDASGSADGVTHAVVKPGAHAGPSIEIDAGGPRLDFRPLPLQPEITAQLANGAGVCWQAGYRDFVRSNASTRFKARSGMAEGYGGH